MTLATALRRAGIGSEIVELNPEWSVLGVGISMQGPALRALRTLGVLDAVVAHGFGYSHFNSCDAAGNIVDTVTLPSINGPDYPATMGIMRQALHDVLKDAVLEAGAPVRLGVTVSDFSDSDDGVAVTFSDGSEGSYDLVVGADGVNSPLRQRLFADIVKPEYTGQAVWRATVPRPVDVCTRHSYFGPRNKAGFNPVSEDRMYIYLVQNLPRWARLADAELPGVMRGLLADFGGHLAAARDAVTDPEQIVYRPIVSMILPAPWYRGRVVLIGDAAHTMTPQMASGAGLAIEDAVVLAEILATGQPVPDALQAFMTRRFDRCRTTVESSHQLGEWEKTPDAPDADPTGLFGETIRMLAQPI